MTQYDAIIRKNGFDYGNDLQGYATFGLRMAQNIIECHVKSTINYNATGFEQVNVLLTH